MASCCHIGQHGYRDLRSRRQGRDGSGGGAEPDLAGGEFREGFLEKELSKLKSELQLGSGAGCSAGLEVRESGLRNMKGGKAGAATGRV